MTMTEPDSRPTDIPITIRRDGVDHDIWCVADPGIPVSGLTGIEHDEVVLVDGSVVDAERSVTDAGIRSGSVIEIRARNDRVRAAGATLVVDGAPETQRLAGPDSGSVEPNRVAAEAALAGEPNNAATTDGNRPIVAIDDTVVLRSNGEVARFARPERGDGASTVVAGVVHRPPTIDPPAGNSIVRVPDVEPPTVSNSRLSWAMVLAPIPLAIAMMTLLGPRALIFAAMSPTLAIGRYLEDRWRARQAEREHRAACDEAAEQLRRQIDGVAHAELQRTWRWHRSIIAAARAGTERGDALWTRRPDGGRFGLVTVGYGQTNWIPEPELGKHPFDGWAATAVPRRTPLAPIELDLLSGNTTGIVGSAAQRSAITRAIIGQLVTAIGPAHLRVVVLTASESDWDFVKWLPHARRERRVDVCTDTADVADVLASDDERDTLVVIDDPRLQGDAVSGLPRALARSDSHRSFIALAGEHPQLPWTCSATISHDDDVVGGSVTVSVLADEQHTLGDVIPVAPATTWVEEIARRLSPLTDPESDDEQAGLPGAVGAEEIWPPTRVADILDSWDTPSSGLAAPIGIGAAGPVLFDFVAHGPHALVAGTTGSGKSELLRTLVAATARHHGPEKVNFVLVDYKGGGAFDVLSSLPHTVAVITDLDDDLAGRALRSLRAELHHRETVLRDHGVSDIGDIPLAQRSDDGLPRLVVVIDEFATLAAELPDFMDALIDIAQRGRSLGLHLVLATQRPAGVVDAKIRANTNARICLRVQDDSDSLDVISERSAAHLPATSPGRAIAKLGDDRITFQAASVSGPRRSSTIGHIAASFAARPGNRAPQDDRSEQIADESTIEAVGRLLRSTAVDGRRCAPRSPWQPPLPNDLDGSDLDPFVIAIGDDPDRQRRVEIRHDPREASLVVVGAVGSGVTTALATSVRATAAHVQGDDLHCYVLDLDGSGISELASLPHVGEVVAPTDIDGRRRLTQMLAAERDRRQRDRSDRPHLLVVVDGADTLRASEDPADRQLLDALGEVARDGTALGMTIVVGARSDRGLGSNLLGAIGRRLILAQNDPSSYLALGLKPRDVPRLPPGRCIDSTSGLVAQVARRVAGPWPAPGGPIAPAIPRLPSVVRAGIELPGPSCDDLRGTWTIPIGLDVDSLAPLALELTSGDRAAVTGQRRSGRTTMLRHLVASVRRVDPATAIEIITPRHNSLADDALESNGAIGHLDLAAATSGAIVDWLAALDERDGRTLVVIDDADRCHQTELAELIDAVDERVTVVTAGRPDVFRAMSSWCRGALRDHVAVLCRPMPGDGDLLRARVVPAAPETPIGRAALVSSGHARSIQLAAAPDG